MAGSLRSERLVALEISLVEYSARSDVGSPQGAMRYGRRHSVVQPEFPLYVAYSTKTAAIEQLLRLAWMFHTEIGKKFGSCRE